MSERNCPFSNLKIQKVYKFGEIERKLPLFTVLPLNYSMSKTNAPKISVFLRLSSCFSIGLPISLAKRMIAIRS